MDTKHNSFIYFLLECIIMGLCYLLTWYVVRKYLFVYVWTADTGTSFRPFYFISLGLIPIYLCVHKLYHLYNLKSFTNTWNEFITVCKADFISVVLFEMILYFGGRNDYVFMFPNSFSVCFFLISTLMIIIGRKCIFAFTRTSTTQR